MTGWRGALALGLGDCARLLFGLRPRLADPPLPPRAVGLSFLAAPLSVPPLLLARWLDQRGLALPHPAWRIASVDLLLQIIGWVAFLLVARRVLARAGLARGWVLLLVLWNWSSLAQALVQSIGDQSRLWHAPALVVDVAWLVSLFWQIWIEWRAIAWVVPSLWLVAGLIALDTAIGLLGQSFAVTLGG